MKNLVEKTKLYLREFEEVQPEFHVKSLPALPIFLRERYKLFVVKLFGENWLLALEEEGWEPGSPTDYRNHVQQLVQVTGQNHIALVLKSIQAKIRNRMIQMRIPFIVPNTQIYLPLALISLKENFGASYPPEGKALSPAAQVLFLIHLLQRGLENQASKEISIRTGYSRASISTACAELQQNQLCKSSRIGKEQHMEFGRPQKDLWKAALPLLKSPVKKRHWVTWNQPVSCARMSGISALSRLSNIADDRIPTFSMQEREVRKGFEQGHFHGCVDPCEADAQLEAWSYDPSLLSSRETVDPLSLYLSLKDNPDERVQSELKAMMENFPWQ